MPDITVSIPYWRSPGTIRRAVEAVLSQTHNSLTCVVVNDGSDPQELRAALSGIHDSRLHLYDLPINRGRYFADAVTLSACNTPWFTVHDADDRARPDWIATQLRVAERTGAQAVFCGHLLHGLHTRTPRSDHPQPFTGAFRHHAHMAGLWRTSFLRDLGGPRPDFRIGYDSMLTGVAMATGKSAIHREILYERHLQKGSLTKAASTRIGSPARKRARDWMARNWPTATKAAALSPATAGKVLTFGIPVHLRHEVAEHATTLRGNMTSTHSGAPAWATCLKDHTLWGDWALGRDTALRLARSLQERQPKVIVEGGSGSTTVLFSQYADAHGARVVSLESSKIFHGKTLDLLSRYRTGTNVQLRHAPLHATPYGPWYRSALPGDIDFAFVDGPRQCDGGRRAALDVLLPHLLPGALVILDDAERLQEQQALAQWKKTHGLSHTPVDATSARLAIPTVKASNTGGAKIAATVLTGRRPDLLDQTLHRMQAVSPGLLMRSHLTVLHNGGDAETAAVLSKYTSVIDEVITTSKLLDIGQATSRLAEHARASGRRYWFHLEDDWCLLPVDPDWLSRAQTILHTRPNIAQVRLRHHAEPVLSRHMVTGRPLNWTTYAGYRMTADAHYTVNPSLIRVKDIEKVWPATGERDAQQRAHRAGLRSVAQLLPGVFVHTGGTASLREVTKCEA
jgi:predicted O-methyltransferase YrrM